MGNLNGQQQGYAAPPQDNGQEFYEEVDQIRGGIDTVNANISRIELLHQRALKDIDESTSQQTQSQLEALVTETSALNNTLVSRIKVLKGKAGRDPSKGPQVGVLDRNFKDALRKYQLVEKNFADRTREQMARQYRIVKPDATEEEVRQACEDSQGQQIFSQAVSYMSSISFAPPCANGTVYSSSPETVVVKPDLLFEKSRPVTPKSNELRKPSLSLRSYLTRWSSW